MSVDTIEVLQLQWPRLLRFYASALCSLGISAVSLCGIMRPGLSIISRTPPYIL